MAAKIVIWSIVGSVTLLVVMVVITLKFCPEFYR